MSSGKGKRCSLISLRLTYKLIAGLNFRHDICIVVPTIELCAKGCFVSADIESMNQAQ